MNPLLLTLSKNAQPETDTRWDLTYYSHSGDLYSGSNIFPPGMGGCWHPDGRRYYWGFVSGSTGGVVQTNVAVQYDISTMDTNGYVLLTDTNNWPRDVHFKPDGTKMYLIMGKNSSYPDIKEYNLSTPWSISTATASGNSFNPGGFYNADRGLFTAYGYTFSIKDDGVTLWYNDLNTDTIYEATMSVAWDTSTAVFTSESYFSAYGQPFGLNVKQDGTKFFIGDQNTATVSEYSTETSWDLTTTINESRSIDIGSDTGDVLDYEFSISPDGFYAVVHNNGFSANSVGYGFHRYEYTGDYTKPRLTYDIEYHNQTANSHSFGYNPGGIRFKPDGTKAYVINRTLDTIVQYSVSPAWDSSGMTEDKSFSVAGQTTLPNGLFIKPDGTELYMADGQNDTIYQYSLSSSWDVGSAALSGSHSVTSQQALPTDVWLDEDGTTMIVIGTAGDPLDKYSLSQAWAVTSATHQSSGSLSYLANAPGSNYGAWGVDFNPAGTKMVISGYSPYNNIQQYNMSSSFDFTDLVYQQGNVIPVIDGGAGNPTGICFGNSGTKLYIASDDDDTLYEYDLT